MGKKSRRRKPPKSPRVPYVARPFAGLAEETDWVALREIVPAATGTARLVDGSTVRVCSYLPASAAGLVTPEGQIWLGLQVAHHSGDASRDLAQVLERARDTEPGQIVQPGESEPGPRLQELLDVETPLDAQVHDGFDFWREGLVEQAGAEAVDALISSADETLAPTRKLAGVPSAYWVEMTGRRYLRWVLDGDEDDLLLALARMRAAGADALAADTRLIGTFRAAGLLVPVWELDAGQEPEALEEPAVAFGGRLAEALNDTGPVTGEVRAARNALATRQITLR